MSASYFIDIFPESRLANVYLPEWGIEYKDLDSKELEKLNILEIDDSFENANEVIEKIKEINPDIVYFTDFLQKIFLFGDPKFWSQKFVNKEETDIVFSEKEIVINIRSKELLRGLWQYPILPIEFIKKIVRETKLEPVFVGQIEDNAYCDELKENFPYARYINHVSPLFDFEVLRRSKNSLVAISTFSFLANWLSDSSKIILPVYGFYSFAASHGEIDLLPIGDERFVFYLLPFIGGISEAKMRSISEEISIKSFNVSEEDLKAVKSRFLSFKENEDDTYVNPTWYLSRYLDASMDIARGFYRDAKDHFLRRGIWEGKIPDHPKNEDKKIVSLNKIAIISSTSEYDIKYEEEGFAKNSVDSSAVERYSFHTSREIFPWLEIDLEKVCKICRIDIYNRDCNDLVRDRCIPLYVYGSEKKISWNLVHVEEKSFGGSYNDHLTIYLYPNIFARFVKITTPNDDCLHLKKVHVYGE
ncbi:discoidin domain-containing protein [Gluconobacter morbifer]|nr:discoidin domain-containing protein [Gluconobacter morbifer]